MLVVVIDESRKKARVVSRRIISKYLPQIGSTTWMGRVSMEGSNEIKKELALKVSKNNAVICYWVRGKITEILWQSGSQNKWDETGLYSYKKRRLPGGGIDCKHTIEETHS